MSATLVRKLENHVSFSDAEKALLSRLDVFRVRHLRAHETIIHEGQAPGAVHLIHEGWACRYNETAGGSRQITGVFLPGDLCDSQVALLREMDHSVATLTPVTLIEIDGKSFERLLSGCAAFARAVAIDALANAAIHRKWMFNMGQLDAQSRLAHLLCELFTRMGSIGRADAGSCAMPLRQTELGEALAMSAVHLNRTLQGLRSGELVELRHRTLIVPDFAALAEIGNFSASYLHLGKKTNPPTAKVDPDQVFS